MTRTRTYDQACFELAATFLDDCSAAENVLDEDRVALAIIIQDAVEVFVDEFEREFAKPA